MDAMDAMDSPLTYRLHEMVWLMDVIADRRLKRQFGISYAKFLPLAILTDLEPSTQHNLAVHLRQTDAAVSRSLGVLAREGLVDVGVSPAHARRNEVRLTAEGRRLAQRCSTYLEASFRAILGRSQVDEQAYFAATVRLIRELAREYEDLGTGGRAKEVTR